MTLLCSTESLKIHEFGSNRFGTYVTLLEASVKNTVKVQWYTTRLGMAFFSERLEHQKFSLLQVRELLKTPFCTNYYVEVPLFSSHNDLRLAFCSKEYGLLIYKNGLIAASNNSCINPNVHHSLSHPLKYAPNKSIKLTDNTLSGNILSFLASQTNSDKTESHFNMQQNFVFSSLPLEIQPLPSIAWLTVDLISPIAIALYNDTNISLMAMHSTVFLCTWNDIMYGHVGRYYTHRGPCAERELWTYVLVERLSKCIYSDRGPQLPQTSLSLSTFTAARKTHTIFFTS